MTYPYTARIALFCDRHNILKDNRNRDLFIILFFVFCISYLISVSFRYFAPRITWGWCALFIGLAINVIASDMISVDPSKMASALGGEVIMSNELEYGNHILMVGFACQLLGLVLSLDC